ncbi:hypothetical protein [Anabaena sp. CCY 9402-a]|uniref:hypothetical protein n=1 Tax=Anabaena sp. CCY 9402-a TaxID=3103867 RepID=UPI0039C71248
MHLDQRYILHPYTQYGSVNVMGGLGRDAALQSLYRRYYFGKLSYPQRIAPTPENLKI